MVLDVVPDSGEVGNYFISNYPPFSVWTPDHIPAVTEALDTPVNGRADAAEPVPLGLYLHIPFCRQRCKFCYFRVYTEKQSSEVDVYLDALARETELYAERAALRDREFEFVYFGGGTPSFLSSDQLQRLIDRISKHWRWGDAREVTFECEPGTFRKSKLETIKAIGVTRLSLGVEHFDDEVLTLNGRGHKSPEVYRAYDMAREVGFDHLNIDLIAGLLGDTEVKWKETVEIALRLSPDSVTIYQLELPHNTVFGRESQGSGKTIPIVGRDVRRDRVDYAFRQFEQAGYEVSSAYTVVKRKDDGTASRGDRAASSAQARGETRPDFVYRDSLWHGADMIGMGVASFSHFGCMHFQNDDTWDGYVNALERGDLPIARALKVNDHQRLIRELILQLKLGHVDAGYFRGKFGVEITDVFSEPLESLVREDLATIDGDDVRLTRAGLMRADGLLPRFFESQFRSIRYT